MLDAKRLFWYSETTMYEAGELVWLDVFFDSGDFTLARFTGQKHEGGPDIWEYRLVEDNSSRAGLLSFKDTKRIPAQRTRAGLALRRRYLGATDQGLPETRETAD
jgi:hypothetical protein